MSDVNRNFSWVRYKGTDPGPGKWNTLYLGVKSNLQNVNISLSWHKELNLFYLKSVAKFPSASVRALKE